MNNGNRIIFPNQIIAPVTPVAKANQAASQSLVNKNSFKDILSGKIQGDLKFSRHAQERLRDRNISLNEEDMQSLQAAVSKARDKGARESLVLMNDLALVVSIKNNTVITAVDGDSLKENVFTNIDSAIIL